MKTKLAVTVLAFVATIGLATGQNQNRIKLKIGNDNYSTRTRLCG